MLPYLAVIGDSFRAAFASRILWAAFVAIWLMLAALSPIGYREDFTTTFRAEDFHNGTRMKAMLAKGLVDDDSLQAPIGRLAAAMPEDVSRQLRRVGEGDEVRIRLTVLADALNGCLDNEDWYDAEAWKSTLRLKELRELDEGSDAELDESSRRRRARLRIEAAMPGVFETRSSRSIMLTYAGMDFPANFAVDKTQFVTLVNQFVIPVIIDWLLGFVLVFLGILVTASIIPDMLQPGSLHLLLSKPVSRPLLLLSKFVGGCAFVSLCVVQLVVGLLLVSGLRLDIWNVRLLWCIPVSVFLFSVFFSVSLLAGLRWRSPILAIAVTTIFGSVCMVVGIVGGFFDGLVTRPQRIQSLAVTGDVLFGATRGGGLVRFDREQNQWLEVFESNAMGRDRVLRPITLGDKSIATARVRGGRFNPFGSGALDLLVLSEADDWAPEPSLRLPAATSSLYLAGDSVLALNTSELAITSRREILEAAGHSDGESEQEEDEGEGEDQNDWLAKLSNMMGSATSGFHSVLPPRMAISPPRGVIVDPQGQWLIAFSRGRLIRLQRPGGGAAGQGKDVWTLAADKTLEGEASRRGVIDVSGRVLLVARIEEPVQLLDASSFEPIAKLELPDSLIPVSVRGLDDQGRFALVTSDGRCRIIESDGSSTSQFSLSRPLGIKEIESIHVDPASGTLYLVHHTDQVDVLSVEDLSEIERIRPSLAKWRLVNRYVITPLRTLIPPTGALGETIAATVSGKKAVFFNDGSEEEELIRYKIVQPVVSCAAFIAVMLAVSCIYFTTRDF
jgi:hypothetical protein